MAGRRRVRAVDGCVVAALLDESGQRVLLQLRDRRADIAFPGHWALPGGALEAHELPADAIARELAEELTPRSAARGLALEKIGEAAGPSGTEHVFAGRLPDGDWALSEGAGSGVFELEHLPGPMPEHHRRILTLVRQHVRAHSIA